VGKAIQKRGEHSKTDSARTELLSDLAAKNGGEMSGLEFRLKDTDSLARKIQADSQEKKISLDEAADSIYDTSRYTMLFDTNNLTQGSQNVMSDLEANGYTIVEVKNTLKTPDAQYRGVNVKVEKDGMRSEVQFHTTQSKVVKDINHDIYDVYRELNPATPQAQALDAEMRANSRTVPTPPGIDALG
jgi:ppGpp synthetase/RelA/SpoT-type nucleotidyltranferase